MTGNVDGGIAHLRMALAEAARLLTVDAENTSFQENDGLYSIQLARWLRVSGDATAASPLATRGLRVFERLAAKDPGNAGWQRSLALARVELAEQAHDSGDEAGAREHARRALAILEPQLADQSGNRDTVLATLGARTLLAAVADDPGTARKLREQALAMAQAQTSGRNDPRLLALQVEALLALGRRAEADVLLPRLWSTGFRDPRFIALLGRQGIRAPAPLGQA